MANEIDLNEELLYLTTLDNPFNPATQNEYWKQYDEDHGYYSDNLLARYLYTSEELSESEQIYANNCAVRDVVDNDYTNKYIAVTKDTKIKPVPIEEIYKV